MPKTLTFKPGDCVKLSGNFLACTGQRKGSEGAKVWTVKACDCGMCTGKSGGGLFINTGEPSDYKGYTAEELAEMPHLRDRHINCANLVHFGKPSLRNEAPYIGKLSLGHEYNK